MKRKLALFITLALAALLLLTACSGAKFSVHKVTFDANGGELGLFEGSKSVQTYGTVDLPIPEREGYVFEGWFIGEGVNESQFTATTLVTSDLTLKAKWSLAEYTVTFIDYYGNVISREVIKYGDEVNAPAVPRIAEERLRFDKWDKDITNITADTEVKALYVIDSYTITYVTNNTQTIPATSYFFNETPVKPQDPSLGGHYFIGWYLDEEFTEEFQFDAPLTSDTTLYAYFNESIPIATLEELFAIPDHSTAKYFLKNDIDCEGAVITDFILGFAGLFDGEGHRIYNFVYQPVAAANCGLFESNSGTIKNITFDNFSYILNATNINSNSGFLVGTNSGAVENISIKNASISYTHKTANATRTSYYGNIIGNNKGSIKGCSVTDSAIYWESNATASGDYNGSYTTTYVGGLAGANSGTIEDSYIDAKITIYSYRMYGWRGGAWSHIYSGGIVPTNEGTIVNSNATVEIKATSNSADNQISFGGLVCHNTETIDSCYATPTIECGEIFGLVNIGGLVETNDKTIHNSFCNIKVTNVATSCIGGFVCHNNGGIVNCYSEGEMNIGAATNGKGGFAGYNNGNINSCFTSVNIIATDATNFGAFVGSIGTASYITNCYYDMKSIYTTNGEHQVFENYYATQADPVTQLMDEFFVTETLGWSAEIWEFDPNKFEYPSIK